MYLIYIGQSVVFYKNNDSSAAKWKFGGNGMGMVNYSYQVCFPRRIEPTPWILYVNLRRQFYLSFGVYPNMTAAEIHTNVFRLPSLTLDRPPVFSGQLSVAILCREKLV